MTAAASARPRRATGTVPAMLRSQLLLEQRIFWRNRSGVFFTFVMPLVLMVAFGLSDDPANNLPLVAALSILSSGFQGLAIQLSMHRDQGVLKRLMSTPLPPWVLIAAKAMSITSVLVVELAVIVGAGVFAFGVPAPDSPVALVLIALLGTATYVAMGFALTSIIPTSDSAPAITNAAYLGLLLVSAVAGNADNIPEWIRTVVELLPFTPLFESIRDAWVGPWRGVEWRHVLVLVAWLALAVWWTTRRFRWEPTRR